MIYTIHFCFLGPGFHGVTLEGPDGFDVEIEWINWRQEIHERIGPQPNLWLGGINKDWIGKHFDVLLEYQERYNYKGDFLALFVEHLVQKCGFTRRHANDVRLA